MTPRLLKVGEAQAPVVVVDDMTGRVDAIVAMAAAMAPFPTPAGSHYPGLRRVIAPVDAAAHGYASALLEAAAPFIGGAFDIERFDWEEASFSLVTLPPQHLSAPQRMPHFDATDPGYLAILHYLCDAPGSGTAFYRQRATGIERVTEGNVARFIAAAEAAAGTSAGYINASTAAYEQITAVEAKRDRLLIYQGSLLHSGIIPDTLPLSADPRTGRLTANLFVRASR